MGFFKIACCPRDLIPILGLGDVEHIHTHTHIYIYIYTYIHIYIYGERESCIAF